MKPAERGNILFLILLAVVLFAALSYAVTQSTRGGGNDASKESAQAKVSWLMNYFTQLDGAVQRMLTTGGVKDYELNFYYQSNSKFVNGNNDNTNCTESRCRVFDPAGGGVSGQLMNDVIRDTSNSASVGRLFYISVPGAGTDKPDIVYTVYKVQPAVCRAINKQAGLGEEMFLSIPLTEASALMYYNAIPTGPIPDTTQTMTGLPIAAGLAGTFCSCVSGLVSTCEIGGLSPAVSHVLVAR